MRSEMAGDFGMTTILQCDLKRTLTINEKTKTYIIMPTDGSTASADGGGGAINPLVSASGFDSNDAVVKGNCNIPTTKTFTRRAR